MSRSKPYLLLGYGKFRQPVGIRVASKQPLNFYAITTDNQLVSLGSTLDGDIDIPGSSYTIAVIYYTFERLTGLPVVELILGREAVA